MVNWSTLLLASFSSGPSCVSLLKSFQIAHNIIVALSVFSLLWGGDKSCESGLGGCNNVEMTGHVENRCSVLSGPCLQKGQWA